MHYVYRGLYLSVRPYLEYDSKVTFNVPTSGQIVVSQIASDNFQVLFAQRFYKLNLIFYRITKLLLKSEYLLDTLELVSLHLDPPPPAAK